MHRILAQERHKRFLSSADVDKQQRALSKVLKGVRTAYVTTQIHIYFISFVHSSNFASTLNNNVLDLFIGLEILI